MPANAQPGHYTIKIEGMLNGGAGGYAFYNETTIDFDAKQASVFIQLSKPIYKQGQTGKFYTQPLRGGILDLPLSVCLKSFNFVKKVVKRGHFCVLWTHV